MARKESERPRKNGNHKRVTADDGSRPKKPELPRTEPIRSWSRLFGADSMAGRAQETVGAGARAASNAVQRGVELGYRVMDEYVRQGTAAAGAFTRNGRGPSRSTGDFPGMTERMMQSAQDFASVWFDMMGTMMNMAGQGGPTEAARTSAMNWASAWTPRATAAGPTDTSRTRLVLGIESNRPTEITLTLDESAPGEDVVVEPLRAATGGEIRDVSLVLAGGSRGTLTLNAKVPSALPPDRYTGALLDGPSGKPRGRLTIAVMD